MKAVTEALAAIYSVPLYADSGSAPKGWVCPACGTDRLKAACPKGHSAALTGQCPMVGTAYGSAQKEKS